MRLRDGAWALCRADEADRARAATAGMTVNPETARIARDATWLVHRYDPGHDAFHLRRLDRAGHRAATFLNDDHLSADLPSLVLRRADLAAAAPPPAPIHFVFHSAFCCSTLIARAFDLPGRAMGLKEPRVLQDIVGVRVGGAEPGRVGLLLNQALALLGRPMQPGEAVVVKPSNILNSLASAMLAMRPGAGALLLHAPPRTFLGSVARKGLWGRLWARELIVGMLKEDIPARLGFSAEQLLGQTDLQVAAVGWLAQHAMFADLAAKFGPARVRTLDSATLMARPAEAMAALAALYRVPLAKTEIAAIVAGPAFTRHSKSGEGFGREARDAENRAAETLHADEIDKTMTWIETVARGAGVPMTLPAPLLG